MVKDQNITDASTETALPLAIPQRFFDAVCAAMTNFAMRVEDPTHRAPQILVITGPPGTGKTTMATASLQALGVHTETVAASSMAGEYEGDSTGPIRFGYLACAGNTMSPFSALILDDYELSAGGIDDQRPGTVNANLLNGLLMKVADNPFKLPPPGGSKTGAAHAVARPPLIVMTANDPRKIFGPLKRAGRTRIFEWRPRAAELRVMGHPLFPTLSKTDIARLVKAFPDQQIVFFEELRRRASEDALIAYLRARTDRRLPGIDFADLIGTVRARESACTIEELEAAGQALLAEDKARATGHL